MSHYGIGIGVVVMGFMTLIPMVFNGPVTLGVMADPGMRLPSLRCGTPVPSPIPTSSFGSVWRDMVVRKNEPWREPRRAMALEDQCHSRVLTGNLTMGGP